MSFIQLLTLPKGKFQTPRTRYQRDAGCIIVIVFLVYFRSCMCYSIFMVTTIAKIDNIKEMLAMLPEDALAEVSDFVAFLLEKGRRRKAFEERVLKAEKEEPIKFETVEDAVKAVFDEAED